MPKTLKDGQTPELGAMALPTDGADPFGPPRPPTIPEMAKQGREFRGEKPLRDALRDALNDLFDAYLYALYHPCGISPHELLALINAHREVMEAQKAAQKAALIAEIEAQKAELEAQQEALWLEYERRKFAEARKALLGASTGRRRGAP
jgi:hypothetical protein